MSDTDWTEVKRKEKKPSPHSTPPSTPRARTESFGELDLTAEKDRMSRTAMKEKKLDWSTAKRRERAMRVEKRSEQRERSVKQKANE